MDRAIAFAVKKICRLPVFGPSLCYLYCPISLDGLGIANCVDEYLLQIISTTFKSLTNRDPIMKEICINRIKRLAKIWCGLEATPEVCANYLNNQRPNEMNEFKYYQYSHMDTYSRFKIAVFNLQKQGFIFESSFDDENCSTFVTNESGKNILLSKDCCVKYLVKSSNHDPESCQQKCYICYSKNHNTV